MIITSRKTAYSVLFTAAFSSILLIGMAQYAQADNVVGTPDSITFNVGESSRTLRVKIVDNTAQSQAGDPVAGCNIGVKNDGKVVNVTLLISPAQGLTATPNPIVFDECNKVKTVTLTGAIGGSYLITASAEDNTPEPGVYHLKPFGTVRVNVGGDAAPETTIDSGPANPTAIQDATFAFSANKAESTFECSLDGVAYASCTSPVTYDDLGTGTHTFRVRATDLSGNTDQSPASFSWTIRTVSIDITSVTPDSAIWGTPVQAQGVADVTDLTAELDWGDGTTPTPLNVINGEWGPVTHSYSLAETYSVIAHLKEGNTIVATSAPVSVTAGKHQTELTLILPEFVTGTTKFLASAMLVDTSAGNTGIAGRIIDFDGDGAPASGLTAGVSFEGTIDYVSCGVSTADPCTTDPIGDDPDPDDNIVLNLGVGSKVTFPKSTAQAVIYLQNMGTTPFKYKVIEYPDAPQDCDLAAAGFQAECSSAGAGKPITARIDAVSGFSVSDGVKFYNGIKEVVITEVDGDTEAGTIGISAVITRSVDGDPRDQHMINFEDQSAPSSPSSPVTFNPGSLYSTGIAQELPEAGLSLEAEFAGDGLYEPSSSGLVPYEVQANLNGLGNSVTASGSGTSVTEYGCVGLSDFDKDGICDEHEATGEIQIDGLSPSISWPFPAGDMPDPTKPDVYYEIDCMSGYCPAQSELDYIEQRFSMQGIKLHLVLDQTNLTVCDPLHVWGDTDSNDCNDFRSIKNNNYGTNAERTAAGGTLADGKTLFKLKSQAVRYLLYVKNINTGTNTGPGPTGIAEFLGNDAIVARAGITTNIPQFNIGTTMHEIGHNFGLLHGGDDDANCKPNYISVMNYNRQVPHSKMPVPSASASTGVGWYGDFSHGHVQLRTSGNALIGDGTIVTESDLDDGNKLTLSGTWKASDHATTITSMRVMWGTPTLGTKIQYANTGTQINWDKDTNSAEPNQSHDTNYMTVTVGTKQLPACVQTTQLAQLHSPGDDYAIVKANIAKFNGASSALLGIGEIEAANGNPDEIPETNLEVIEGLNSLDYQFGGVAAPLTNAAFGETGIATSKKGSTIHARFNFYDGFGTEITSENANSYQINKIIMRVAPVTASEPPADEAYFAPGTSTQTGSADFFTWDGSKWGFQFGTKNLSTTTYAARIYAVQETGEEVVLDHNGDGISFLFKLVKN